MNGSNKKTVLPRGMGDIFAHRPLLYGFSALWIMFFHFKARLPSGILYTPIKLIRSSGNAGVEIFLILTSYGLYKSLERNNDIWRFYYRRLCRLILSIIPVSALFYGVMDCSTTTLVTSFVFPDFWFVRFILVFYAVFPLINILMRKTRRVLPILCVLSIAFSFIADFALHLDIDTLRAVTRIPITLFGCIITSENRRKEIKFPKWLAFAALGAFLILRVGCKLIYGHGLPYSLMSVCYFFLAVFLIFALCAIGNIVSRVRIGCFMYRCVAVLGEISLEMYLLFERLQKLFKRSGMGMWSGGHMSKLKLDMTCAVMTILLGFLIRIIAEKILSCFEKIKIPNENG